MQIMEYLIPWSEFEKNSHRYGDEGVPYYVVETSSHASYRPKERYVTDSLKKAKAHGKGSPYADIEKLIDGAVVGRWGRDPKHPDFLWLGGYGGGERESNPVRKPTIYEALRSKLGREPTRAELKADVERIKREALEELAAKGKLRHQRKRNPMKKRANDLTTQAMEGYSGEPLKYLYSSPSWYAYKIGEHFRESGRPEPSDVRMGRGYSINVRDMTFSFGKNNAVTRVK